MQPENDAKLLDNYVLFYKNIKIGQVIFIIIEKFQNNFGYNLKVIGIIDTNSNILKYVLRSKLQSDLDQMFYNSLEFSI